MTTVKTSNHERKFRNAGSIVGSVSTANAMRLKMMSIWMMH